MNDNNAISNVQVLPANRRTVLLALHWEHEPYRLGILEHARRKGWHLLDLQYYNMMLPPTFQPDGIIFHLAEEEAPLANKFLGMGIPVVQIQDYHKPTRCCCVVQDRKAIGQAAAEHFAARAVQERHLPPRRDLRGIASQADWRELSSSTRTASA